MYTFLLAVHNLLRWIVLVLLIVALVRAYWGWFGKRQWTHADGRVGTFYSISLDIQLLIGLILYIALSPLTRVAFSDFSAAWSNPDLRFFVFEHLLVMILAVVFAHVGVAMAKRAEEDVQKHRLAALWFTLSLLAILVAMPWFRPLLPGL